MIRNWPPEAKPGGHRHQNVFSGYWRAAIECDVLSTTPSARFNWLRPELAPAKRVSRRRPDCSIRSAAVNCAFVRETYPCALHPLRNHWRLAREGTETRPQISIHGVPFLLTRMICRKRWVPSLAVAFEGLFGRYHAPSMVEEGQTEGRPRWLSVRRGSPHGKFRLEIAGLSPDQGCFLVHVTPREAGVARSPSALMLAAHDRPAGPAPTMIASTSLMASV